MQNQKDEFPISSQSEPSTKPRVKVLQLFDDSLKYLHKA